MQLIKNDGIYRSCFMPQSLVSLDILNDGKHRLVDLENQVHHLFASGEYYVLEFR